MYLPEQTAEPTVCPCLPCEHLEAESPLSWCQEEAPQKGVSAYTLSPWVHSCEIKASSGKEAMCWRPWEMWLRVETLSLLTALLKTIFQLERVCSPHFTDKPPAAEWEKAQFTHYPCHFGAFQVKGNCLHCVLHHQRCGCLF